MAHQVAGSHVKCALVRQLTVSQSPFVEALTDIPVDLVMQEDAEAFLDVLTQMIHEIEG